MKKWLLVLLIFSGIFPLYSQSLPQYFLEWADSTYNVYSHGIGVDSQSNVYVGYSDTMGVYFLKKMDASGNDLWIDTVDIRFTWSYVTSDGTIYTAGNLTPSELILAAWNSEGIKLWQDTAYTPFDTCTFKKIWVNTYHEAFLAGFSNNNVLWITRYDSMGEIMDTVSVIPDSTWEYFDFAFDDSGNVYMLGTYSNDTDSTTRWITEKLDKNGNLIWSNYNDFDYYYGSGLVIHVTNSHVYSFGSRGYMEEGWLYVLKYDKNTGVLLDSLAYSMPSYNYFVSTVAFDDSENIYVGAVVPGLIPRMGGYGIISKINSQGDYVWDVAVNDGFWTSVAQLSVDTHSNIYALLGVVDDDAYNTKHMSVFKYTSSAGVGEQAKGSSDITINAPAITKGDINLTYSVKRPGEYSIEVYSVDGRCIRRVFDNRPGTHYFTVNNLKNGIYFVRLQQKRESVTRKIIVER